MLQELKRECFDRVIREGTDLILFFYQKDQAESILTLSSVEEVEKMIGKNFQIYVIDSVAEPEISEACSVTSVPETISIKQTKIYKRGNGILKSNEILNLLK